MDRQEARHQRAVDELALRLSNKHYYDVVLKNPHYKTNNFEGELDVIAIRGKTAHYYEVKWRDTESSLYRAENQVDRVQMAFPMWNVRGIYVPVNGGVRRL